MSVIPVRRLDVWRTLSDGSRCQVGTLAQNRQGIFFQYLPEYLAKFSNLSPFNLNFDASLQLAQKTPHHGLHGVFSDSLPDGWGLLLMNRIFRQSGTLAAQLTPMDRLAFVGNSGMGALSYEPASDLQKDENQTTYTIAELGLNAQSLFDGQTTEVLAALVAAGSSAGARPKAQLYLMKNNPALCSTRPQPDSKAYLVKFTSSQLALGHEEGICEAAYLTMAKLAGIKVPEWKLLNAPTQSGANKWLALERFDIIPSSKGMAQGRLHLPSACGLLDADFRLPSMDYEDLIKASSLLCKSPGAGQQQFRRAIFNLFALNQDDHSKNWAFLQNDTGEWQLAPFYDVTFSPAPHGEHATAFIGFGKNPPLKTMQKLASHANFASWKQAQMVITEVVETLGQFATVARKIGVADATITLICKQLDQVYQDNKILLQ